jgi:hypothetical protein
MKGVFNAIIVLAAPPPPGAEPVSRLRFADFDLDRTRPSDEVLMRLWPAAGASRFTRRALLQHAYFIAMKATK